MCLSSCGPSQLCCMWTRTLNQISTGTLIGHGGKPSLFWLANLLADRIT
jgi:hypothetical protein